MTLKTPLRWLKYGLRHPIFWAQCDVPNWGDDLNPWLFRHLTGRDPVYCPHPDVPRLLMVGSVLDTVGPLDSCWGSGYIKADAPPTRMRRAYAVRGPLSAQILSRNGITPPRVFGDPGLLAPKFIEVDFTKRYSVGVIPHYVDTVAGSHFAEAIGATVISVSLPIEEFVQAVARAERIFSSSLHGLICAEALGVPCRWIRFSEKLIGGCFKFHDYLSGTDRRWEGVTPLGPDEAYGLRSSEFSSSPWNRFEIKSVQQRLIECFPYRISARCKALFS